jgi:CRISPR system Cascade subunit CasB
MSAESRKAPQDRATRFVEYLCGFAEREDRGALAALRRSLQEPAGIAMSACPYVVPFLPAEPDRFLERAFFLVGALFALHPDRAEGVSLGHAFRRINSETAEGQKGGDNESTRARFVALLDAHPDDIAEHLRHAVSLARAKEIGLDWVRMLKDLLNWRAPDRWVQRRLATDFWGGDSRDPHPAPSASPPPHESETPR